MYRNREDAGRQLAERLQGRSFHDPLVLAIPRGGVVTGAVLAWELHADLDVILSRKLRAPKQPEVAIGAISEGGQIYVNYPVSEIAGELEDYLARERTHQLAEIVRRGKRFRSVKPQAPVAGRSVIVTDDGIATGSTMIAALQAVKLRHPRELLVAVPVAAPEALGEISHWCDEVVCLLTPERFWAVGQFYREFPQVDDNEVVCLLRSFAATPANFGESRQGHAVFA